MADTIPESPAVASAAGPDLAPPLEPAERVKRKYTRRADKVAAPAEPAPEVEVGHVEAAWQGTFMVIRLIAGWFGYECDVIVLPAAEAKADAKVLLLIPGIQRLTFLSWIGAPVVIIQRLAQHFRKASPAQAGPVQAPIDVAPPVPPPPPAAAPGGALAASQGPGNGTIPGTFAPPPPPPVGRLG